MSLTTAQEAMGLAKAGQADQGLQLLRDGQRRGEAESFLLEGLWLLEGRFAPQNFESARQCLSDAAKLGHIGAARTLAGLVACGVGTDADWRGAVKLLGEWVDRDPVASRQAELIARMDLDDAGQPFNAPIARQLNADPRVERVDGLLTVEECQFLIELADPRMRRATIFHDAAQRFVEDPIRRSDKAGFPIVSEWPFIRAINQRIAVATRTPVDCGEPLQVLRYGVEQEYRPHFDAIAGMGNPRVMTALIWLNEDYSGGATSFPEVGLNERGSTGDLLLFANTLPDGSPDARTRHSGEPVTQGTKYMASRWMRARPPGPEGFGRHEIEKL